MKSSIFWCISQVFYNNEESTQCSPSMKLQYLGVYVICLQ